MNAPIKFDDHTKLNWWQSALKGERRPITVNEPMTGYYRARSKNKQTGEEALYAVAYWWHGGNCFCRVNSPGVVGTQPTLQGDRLQRMIDSWPHVSKEPISYDVYLSVVAGNPWPDQHVAPKAAPADVASTLPSGGTTEATVAGAADPYVTCAGCPRFDDCRENRRCWDHANQAQTPQGVLKREIEAARAGIIRYVKRGENGEPVSLIDSDDMSGAAQTLRASLLALSNRAKKAREEANRPHNDAIRANGAIWSPLEAAAKAAADGLRDGPMKAWEVHKRDQLASATKAAAAATAAVGHSSGVPFEPKSNAPAPSARIKGATGKAASVSTVKIAVIHDQDAVYAHFKSNDQVKAILQGLANAAVRAGIEVPGVTVAEDVAIK